MKKIILFLFIIGLVGVSCSSCKKKDNEKDEEDDSVVMGEIDQTEAWLDTIVKKDICDDLSLPTKSLDGLSDISWSSSNPRTLTETGEIKVRPKEKTEVELTATITRKDLTEEKKYTVFVYPKSFTAVVARFKTTIPDEISEDIDYLDTVLFDYYNITWTSSDDSVLTNEGKYIKPENDTPVTISFHISVSDDCFVDEQKEVIVKGITDAEKIEAAYEWLTTQAITDLSLSKDISLPETDPSGNVKFSWETTDDSIISNNGKVTRYVFDRYVEVLCTLNIDDNFIRIYTFWFIIEALDTSKMTQVEILENFLSAIAVDFISEVTFSSCPKPDGTLPVLNQSHNYLRLFDNVMEKRIENLAPTDAERDKDSSLQFLNGNGEVMYNRPGIIQKSTEFIVVHDTANTRAGATAKAHSDYVYQGGNDTSFQYVVGNDGIYHNIPDNEVSYHAGDGRREYELIDTGIKATAKIPNLSISSDGYYSFNGVKSTIHIPVSGNNAEITPSGIYFEIGDNGNYWMNTTYYNSTYEYLCNQGGNRNSIGIETCVDDGSDYMLTLKINANLVAMLLIENNLDVNRVMQHNNMSGKDCPNSIRSARYWQKFRDWVSLYKFGFENFKGLSFIWVSASPELETSGKIAKNITPRTTVSYGVTVKLADKVIFTKDYKTVVF